jgi:hypothetical protein
MGKDWHRYVMAMATGAAIIVIVVVAVVRLWSAL